MLVLLMAWHALAIVLDEQNIARTSIKESTDTVFADFRWEKQETFGSNGGAVDLWSSSIVEFIRCKFIDTKADGNAQSGGGCGGAVHGEGGRLYFTDCVFSKCVANWGGAIHMQQSQQLVIEHCKFSDCKSNQRGSVFHIGGGEPRIEFVHSFVSNCRGIGDASLISMSDSKALGLTFDNNSFECSLPSGTACGILFTMKTPAEFDFSMENCSFSNSATGTDKAIRKFFPLGQAYKSITMVGCSFSHIETSDGTGAAISPIDGFIGTLTLISCNFTELVSAQKGGAIHSGSKTTKFVLKNCIFEQCLVRTATGNPLNGGGAVLVETSVTNCEVLDCKFTQNACPQRSQSLQIMVGDNPTISITGCHFTDHDSQGPILSLLKSGQDNSEADANIALVLEGCEFVTNILRGSDGVVRLLSNQKIEYCNCMFVNNEVAETGTGLVTLGCTDSAFEGCVFENCATGSAGICSTIERDINSVKFNNCTFSESNFGVGIVKATNVITNVEITASRVDQIHVKSDGFVLDLTGAQNVKFVLKNTNITNCDNEVGGGNLLKLISSDILIDDVNVHSNKAGSIFLQSAGTIKCLMSNFESCESPQNEFISVTSCTTSLLFEECDFSGISSSNHIIRVESAAQASFDRCYVKTSSFGGILCIDKTVTDCKINKSFFVCPKGDVSPVLISSSSASISDSDCFITSTTQTRANSPLIMCEGTSFDFYNCCFTHAESIESGSFGAYLGFGGSGHATLELVCFEGDRDGSVSISEGFAVEGLNESSFGNCVCSTFKIEEETSEEETSEGEETSGEPAPKPEGIKNDSKTPMIVGIVVGLFVVIAIVVVLLILFVFRRRRDRSGGDSGENELEDEEDPTTTATATPVPDEWIQTSNESFLTNCLAQTEAMSFGFEEVLD